MNVIKALERECRENLFREKILIVSSHQTGRNIIKRLEMPVLNLKTATIRGLAEELTGPFLHSNDLTLIHDSISQQVLFGLLFKLHQNGEFEYFKDITVTPSLSNSIWQAVMELKYAGVKPDDPIQSSFVCASKGRDMGRILSEYDTSLKQQRFIDSADLLDLAIQCKATLNAVVYILDDLKLCDLEKRFIAKICPTIRVLYHARLEGLKAPAFRYGTDYPEKVEASPFAQLYAGNANVSTGECSNGLKGKHPDDRIRLVKAFGESNEVQAVFRSLKAEQRPADDCCVYVTTNEPYAGLFYSLHEQTGIPITFGYGINIGLTRPGQAVLSLLRWIISGYPVMDLYNLLSLGLVKPENVEEETVSAQQTAYILRSSGIGWGRDRYVIKLEEQLKMAEALLLNSTQEEKAGIERKLQNIQTTLQLIQALWANLPTEQDGQISIPLFAKGLSEIVRRFITVKNEYDGAAKEAILQALTELAMLSGLKTDAADAVRSTEDILQNIRIGTSGPKPGHLHLCHYQDGAYLHRKVHWFLGLDGGRFPGRATEDPILLDAEKIRISDKLLLNRDKTHENLYAMVQLLSGLEGEMRFCYSASDPVENREQSPSPLLLQIYRMLSGDSEKDYSDLKKALSLVEGYIPKDGLSPNEFWLNRFYRQGNTRIVTQSVQNCYPHLQQGMSAWAQRLMTQFTAYDGFVGKTASAGEPIVFSASRLELLAKCAYQYYLRYILNISPPRDIVYDPEAWLDPLTKGTLYHSIFEKFYRTITEKGEKPNRDGHRELILKIARDLIEQLREEIPPPGEIVFDMEKREILESCVIFLTAEEEYADEGTPELFELGFGLSREEGYPPVEITLKSGRKILLGGKIDRIDKLQDGIYRVVDYKSGSTYGYRDREFFKGGRQIQHALYTCACEMLLGGTEGKVAVSEGVYLFPTRKGEGRRFVRTQRGKETLLALLEDLMTILDEGVFAPTVEPEDCRWCDYQAICRIHLLHSVIAAKWEDTAVNGLSAVRRLKTYE